MRRTFLSIVAVFIALFLQAHPVHVSVCNIEIEEEKLTVAIKMFSNDFQLALQHNFGKIIPVNELTLPENKSLVNKYVRNAIRILLNKNDTVRLEYNNAELNEEAIWLYYTQEIGNIKKLEIINSLLLDIYLDQTNLVIINYRGKQNGYRFNARNFEEVINLK